MIKIEIVNYIEIGFETRIIRYNTTLALPEERDLFVIPRKSEGLFFVVLGRFWKHWLMKRDFWFLSADKQFPQPPNLQSFIFHFTHSDSLPLRPQLAPLVPRENCEPKRCDFLNPLRCSKGWLLCSEQSIVNYFPSNSIQDPFESILTLVPNPKNLK